MTAFSMAVFVMLAADAPPAAASPETQPPALEPKNECFARHEDAQVARRQRRLLEARTALRQCSGASCLGAIRADCIDWLAEVERSIPTVVITARARGADLFDVKVIIDDKPVTERLTGAAIELEPGAHKFRFESPPWPAIERTILVVEGFKDRPIDVDFAPVMPAAAPVGPPPAPFFKPPTRFDYAMAGTAAAALVTSIAFGSWGLVSRSDLDDCAPFCTDEDKNPVRAKLIVADVALGVAVVSLAIVFFHMRAPAGTSSARAGTPLVFASPTGGGGIGWGGRF
jgi:hypothetical protein